MIRINNQDEVVNDLVDRWMSNTNQNNINHTPMDDLELRYQMITPDAKQVFDDINKDMILSNLNESELIAIRINGELLSELMFIKERYGLVNQETIDSVRRERDTLLNTSLSKDGFLRRLLQTNIQKFALDKDKKQDNQKTKLKFRG